MDKRSYNALFSEATPQIDAVNPIIATRKVELACLQNTTNNEKEFKINKSTPKGANTFKELLFGIKGASYLDGETLTLNLNEIESVGGAIVSEQISTTSVTIPTMSDGEFERETVTDDDKANSITLSGTITLPANSSFSVYAILEPNTGSSSGGGADLTTLENTTASIKNNTDNLATILTQIQQINSKVDTTTVTNIDETTPSIIVHDNEICNCGTVSSLEILYPALISASFTSQINFTSGSTPTTLIDSTTVYSGDDTSGGVFTPAASKRYMVMLTYDGLNYRGFVSGV